MKSKQELKKVFENGDKPKQEDFWEWQDSYWHKEEDIPIEQIEELENSLDSKANIDASNINTETWQSKLELDQKILTSIDGLNYNWSPTNRTLTLSDVEGNQISQVSLLSLDNEGTDFRYNSSTTSLELWNADNELLDSIPVSSFIGSVGTQIQLNSNQLQLKDSQGNILSTVTFAVSNINGLQTVLDGKLSKPSTIGNTTSYPYVIGEDGSGNSARLPAGDLGKNFFNADLSNTSARNHTMNAGVSIDTLGNAFSVKNLPNKSTDTTFNRMIIANSTGQQAFIDNSYNVLKSTITPMTDAQKLEIANLLGASTGSAGTPSVNLISPPIVQSQYNSVEYILLRGANLYLNSASMSVEILAADKTTVVATIPNNQIQLYADGTQLIFYYNFYNWTNGQYFIRLTSGIKTYTTTLDLNILQNIVNKDLTTLNWDKLYDESVTANTSDNAFGLYTTMMISKTTDGTLSTRSFLSDEIFAQGENFYMEVAMTFNITNFSFAASLGRAILGVCYSNQSNVLQPVSLIKLEIAKSNNKTATFYNNSIGITSAGDTPTTKNLIIIKTGNLFRMIVDSTNYSVTLSNNSGYKLILQAPNFGCDILINTQIVKAFTF